MQDLTKIETEYLQAHEGDISDAEFDAAAMERYHAREREKTARYVAEKMAKYGLTLDASDDTKKELLSVLKQIRNAIDTGAVRFETDQDEAWEFLLNKMDKVIKKAKEEE